MNYELHVWPAGSDDIISLDPVSLEAASYLAFFKKNDFKIIESSSSDPQLPYLRVGPHIYSGPAAILKHLSGEKVVKNFNPSLAALAAVLDTEVLPLVLHSLYSLPKNYKFIRTLLCDSLPFPTNYYRPEALRASSQRIVDSQKPTYWNLGGEAMRDEEAERKRKRDLLGGAELPEILRKQELETTQGKETMKRAFGEGRIAQSASEIFTSLESLLHKSSTPYFFSSPEPTAVDIKLSSFLSLILYLPLPVPLLKDLINSNHPRLFSHTALMRRTLWTDLPTITKSSGFDISTIGTLFPPLDFYSMLFGDGVSSAKITKKETKEEQEFRKQRNYFLLAAGITAVGWGLGTGAITIPFFGSSQSQEKADDDYWEQA